MHIAVVGLSHRTAPVEVRDKVVFSSQKLGQALAELKSREGIRECVILSTCNRSEVYAATVSNEGVHPLLVDFFSDVHEIERKEIEGYLFFLQDEEVVRHIFAVACGLESMVMGEPQIAGQVKEAHSQAMNQGTTGVLLNRLFSAATEVSKRARTETEIGAGAVSVSFAAVELAKKIFDRLEGLAALLIGAGEMSELTARHLISAGISSITVISRTLERATGLAQQVGGRAVEFKEGLVSLDRVDIVISSTSAPGYILRKDDVAQAMRRRKNDPIFFIDIAVPRDIDPEVGSLYNVFLYDIDDLESMVADNLSKREREAEKARAIVEEEVSSFISWQSSLDVVPTIVSLREKFQEIGEQELRRSRSKLAGFSEEAAAALIRSYMNKLLHDPTVRLKAAASSDDGAAYVRALRHLFDLDLKDEKR